MPKSVPLNRVVANQTNFWNKFGPAPFSDCGNQFGIALTDETKPLFHLAVIACLSDFPPRDARENLLANPHWQYFCGYEDFQLELSFGEKRFKNFYASLKKNPKWTKKNLNQILTFSVHIPTRGSRRRTSEKPVLLRDLISEKHPLAIARQLLADVTLEKLRPDWVDPPEFLLELLLSNHAVISQSRRKACAAFECNPYWQHFCGSKVFGEKTPLLSSRMRARLKRTNAWVEAKRLFRRALNRAYQVARSDDQEASLYWHCRIAPTLSSSSGRFPRKEQNFDFPGSRSCTAIARNFKNLGWSTTMIGSDDLHIAQKNLYGPLLRFIHVADRKAADDALQGNGPYADVVLREATDDTRGRIVYQSNGPSDAHARLEAALAPAGSLSEFINSTALQSRYFEALSLIHPPHRFPRRSYEAILSQLRELLVELPEVGERLWLQQDITGLAFTVYAKEPAYGRSVVPKEFQHYLEEYLGPSAESSKSITSHDALRAVVEDIEKQLREAGDTAEIREQLRSAPEVQRTVNLLLRACLNELFSSEAQSKDADGILNFFKQLKECPSAVLGDSGILDFTQEFWIPVLRSALPSVSDLLSMQSVFPPLTRRTRRGRTVTRERFAKTHYDFVPVSRALHGIWRGIPYNDCVGGHPGQLDQLMPERWATPALEGSVFYHVIRNGMVKGYCQLMPVQHEGATYISVDQICPPLFNLKSGKILLFEELLEKARVAFPKGCKGYVMGAYQSGREPYETEILQAQEFFRRGRVLGLPREFTFQDPLAERIAATSEALGYGSKYRERYGSRMLTDAAIGHGPEVVHLHLAAFNRTRACRIDKA